jgi:integrase
MMIEPGWHLGYRKPQGRKGKPAGAGAWVWRHYLDERRYETRTFATADDFSDGDGVAILSWQQAQNQVRAELVSTARAAAGVAGPVTVKAAVDSYLDWLENSRKSARDARWRAAALIYPALGTIEIAKLTPDQIRRWHADLAKVPGRLRTRKGAPQRYREDDGGDETVRRRRSTANRVLTILRAALNHAFRDGKVTTDAAWRRVTPFRGVEASRLRYLTLDEATRLINACDPEFRPLVQGALQTGARYGELCRLLVHDFNLDAGTIAVRQSKSGKPRYIVLTDEGVSFFRELTAGRAGGELMFCKTNGEPWRSSHQTQPMREACIHANLRPKISFHGLRHTWASLAIMNGTPLLVAARNLGHRDGRMVERHYGHLAASYVTDAIRSGAPRFGFTPDPKIAALRGT